MHHMSSVFAILALVTPIGLLPYVYAAEEPPTFEAKVGESKRITFKLANNVDRLLPFTYIIQVKNEEGIVEQISWVSGVLQVRQEVRPQQSWIPERSGEYTIEIFIWESLIGNPLAPSLSMKVQVM